MALRKSTRVRGGAADLPVEEPVQPLAAGRSAVALPTALGVARPVWALTQEMAMSWWLRTAVRRRRTR